MLMTNIISEEIKQSRLFSKKQHKYLYMEEKKCSFTHCWLRLWKHSVFDCHNATAWILNEADWANTAFKYASILKTNSLLILYINIIKVLIFLHFWQKIVDVTVHSASENCETFISAKVLN